MIVWLWEVWWLMLMSDRSVRWVSGQRVMRKVGCRESGVREWESDPGQSRESWAWVWRAEQRQPRPPARPSSRASGILILFRSIIHCQCIKFKNSKIYELFDNPSMRMRTSKIILDKVFVNNKWNTYMINDSSIVIIFEIYKCLIRKFLLQIFRKLKI